MTEGICRYLYSQFIADTWRNNLLLARPALDANIAHLSFSCLVTTGTNFWQGHSLYSHASWPAAMVVYPRSSSLPREYSKSHSSVLPQSLAVVGFVVQFRNPFLCIKFCHVLSRLELLVAKFCTMSSAWPSFCCSPTD